MKRKIVCMLITAAMLTSGSAMLTAANAAGAVSGTTIIYDGQSLSFDVLPVNIDGTILVPMRAIFETFGAKVKWDGDTMTVTAKKGSKVYTMTIGESTITLTKDDEVIATVEAEQVLQIIDGRTMIPLRALSELLGLDVSWDGDTQTVTITTPVEESDDAWKENTGVIDVTSLTSNSEDVSVSGKVITITAGGDYTVTGTNSDAQIVVDTNEKVKLRLSGVELTNTDGAAIYVKSADKCYITVNDGTINTLTDGGEYTEESETNSCIYSKDDLEIKGKGTLVVNGTRHNGITAKDDLSIENGNITVNSVADGIHVNDTAKISGGTVTITAGADGIQSESILEITDGDIDITCTGEVTVSASTGMFGGWGGSTADEDEADEDVSSKGLKAEWLMDISGGTITISSNDTCIKCESELDINGGTITLTSESKKGIKGMDDVYINDGTIEITKATEGIESKHILTVNGGNISVTASDDGFNAGGNGNDMMGGFGGFGGQTGSSESGDISRMTPPDMQNGDMSRMTPPDMQNGNMENGGMQQGMGRGRRGGMGMQQGGMGQMTPPDMQNGDMSRMTPPDIQNGDMSRMTPPDMQNGDWSRMTPPDMSGDTEGGAGNGGMQRGGFGMGGARSESTTISTEHHIEINGGTIYINSQGDGIDSNGSLVINGGYVVVDGPTSSGNGAIDHDGLCQVNGGTLIAIGSSGMIEAPASSSEQNTISAYISASAGDVITITDSSGTEILSYTANKSAGHVMYSSSEVKTGETYTVYVNGTEQGSGTISAAVTSIGTRTGSDMGGGFGGMGGFGRRGMQQSETTEQ